MNIDLGFLLEAKLTDGIYTRCSLGYQVEAAEASSRNQGGIALCYCDSPYFQVESVVKHGANVISLELVTGQHRMPVVGVYMPPADTSTLALTVIFHRFVTLRPIHVNQTPLGFSFH